MCAILLVTRLAAGYGLGTDAGEQCVRQVFGAAGDSNPTWSPWGRLPDERLLAERELVVDLQEPGDQVLRDIGLFDELFQEFRLGYRIQEGRGPDKRGNCRR